MLLKELIKEGTSAISALYPEREAREMVLSYLESTVGTSRHKHIIEPSYSIPDDAVLASREAFARMAAGEPLQYVVGKAWFYGREFNVSPDVLIPRQETEILCRKVCDYLKDEGTCSGLNMKILDLCTGSGCIAWTLALENPGASVVAVDISDAALSVAEGQGFEEETARTGASAPCFMKADVLAEPFLPGVENESFDILVSNPPYVMDSEKVLMRPNVLEHEPHLALFVPDNDPLLFYRAIACWALAFMKPGGLGIVEINEALGSETADIYRQAGFSNVRVIRDLNDKDRFIMFHTSFVEQFV